MAASVAELLVRIDATTETLRRELARADKSVESASTSMLGKLSRFEAQANKAMAGAAKAATQLGTELLAAQASGDAAYGKLIRAAESYGKTQAKVTSAVSMFISEQAGLDRQIGRSATALKEYEDVWSQLFAEQDRAIDKTHANLNDLKAQYDPIRSEIKKYGAEVLRVNQILDAANATESERRTILSAVNAQYDPAEKSIRRFGEEQETLRLKTEATNKALAEQRLSMIETARAAQLAEDAQRTFNSTLGVQQNSTGAARESATAFQSMFDREDAETAKRELAQQWEAILITEGFAQQERIQQTKQATAANWQAMLIAEEFAAQEAKAQLANDWRAMLIQEELAQKERIQQTKQAVAQNWAAQMAMEDMDRGSTQIEAYRRLVSTLDPLTAATDRYNRELAELRAGAAAAGVSVERLAQLESALAAQHSATVAKLNHLNEAQKTGITGFKSIGQAAQQGGYQLQDFVVQVGGGQNALIAFAQQASQFIGFFGAGGAIAGAVLSIVAVGANMLMLGNNTKKAAEEGSALDRIMKDLNETLNDQKDELSDLAQAYETATDSRRKLMRLDLADQLRKDTMELRQQNRALRNAVEGLGRGIDVSLPNNQYASQIAEFRQLDALAKSGDILGLLDALNSSSFNDGSGGIKELVRAILDLNDSTNQAREGLNIIDQGLTKTLSQSAKTKDGLNGATGALSDLGDERGWIDAAQLGVGALRDLGQQLAINAAETRAYQAAWKLAMRDGVVSAEELAEITRLVAEAGDNASRKFDLENGTADKTVSAIERIISAYSDEKKVAIEVANAQKYLNSVMVGGDKELQATIASMGGASKILRDYEQDLLKNTDAYKKKAHETKIANEATARFNDVMEDASRFLTDQAGGITEAEKAYRPFAAQIEKLNDLKAKEGLTTLQLIGIEQQLGEARRLGEEAMKRAEKAEERRLQRIRDEVDLLGIRNDLLSAQLKGGYQGQREAAVAERTLTERSITEQVDRYRESLLDANDVLSESSALLVNEFKKRLDANAALEHQIKMQDLANNATDSFADSLSALVNGDLVGAADGLSQFAEDLMKLDANAWESGEAFKSLGDSLLTSTAAASALGDLVGSIFGDRSDAQQKNAKIGEKIGGTIGKNWGPIGEAIGTFIGNVTGGLFGPGKSDSTASVEIWNRQNRFKTTDTSPSKQDAGNMSARDALADSILQFSQLLQTATGGLVVDKVDVHVGSRDGNTWSTGYETGRTAVGDIEGTLSQVLAAVTRTLTGVSDELKAKLTGIDFSNLERAESDVNFVLNYETAIGKLNGTLEGGDEAVASARQAVVDLTNYVRDFGSQAQRLGYDTEETTSALRAYVERFAGIGAAIPEMTEIEVQVASLSASFAELAPLLQAVGYSAEEAATAVAQAQANQMAALRANVSGAQDARYNDLIGNSFINDIRDLIEIRDTEITDALAVGLTDSGAIRNFEAAIQGVLSSDLRTDQLEEAIRLFGDIPGVTAAANAAIASLGQTIEETGRTAGDIAQERMGLERQLLELQGDTVAIRVLDRAALDASNVALFDQIKALEDQKAATEAATAAAQAAADAARQEAGVTYDLADRVAALADTGRIDASIRELERRQNAEFRAAQEAGYTADQLIVLAGVLAGEMTYAVHDLNRATTMASEDLQKRLLAAQASNPLLNDTEREALEAQARQIDRARELSDAVNDNVRATLNAIYAAEDQALANQAVADAAAEAAQQVADAADALDRLRGLGGNIRQWIDQIRSGGLEGYLSPQQQLANAQTQFQTQLALAQGGNEDALGSITEYAQRLIEEQQQFSGSGGATQQVISDVLAGLENLPAVKSFDQQQLELLQQIAANTNLSAGAIRISIQDEVTRTVGVVNVSTTLTDEQKALALLTTGEVTRTIGLLSGVNALTPQQASLALLTTQQVSRAINITVNSSSLSEDQIDLALLAGGSIQRTVNLAITDQGLSQAQRDVLFAQAGAFSRTLNMSVSSPTLSNPARDLLLGSASTFSRVMELAASSGSGLTDQQRETLLSSTGRISKTIELGATQPQGLTADQKLLLDADAGTIQRTISQAIQGNALTDDQRNALNAVPGTIQRVIDQRVTVSGTVLTAENLSSTIALEIGNVAFAGQALANRYLAAIAMNTARMVGVSGGGVWATDDPNMAGDQAIYETRSAALLNVPAGGGGGPNDGYLPYLASIHSVLAGFSTSLNVGGFIDKIRHNTAETARALGGYASYATGTDFHPGGMAIVGEEGPEMVNLPRGAQVMTAPETARFMRARPAIQGVSSGAANHNGWAEVADTVKSLEKTVHGIAKAQASQQSSENRDVVQATNNVTRAVRERRTNSIG